MNEWEKHLLSWTPRRPSARLRRRIFGVAPAAADTLSPFRFSWLAPATAAAMMMCVLFNQRYGAGAPGPGTPGPLLATILSNASAAAYLPGSVQAEQNNLPADAFKWQRRHDAAPVPASLSQSPGSNRQ